MPVETITERMSAKDCEIEVCAADAYVRALEHQNMALNNIHVLACI